jgi:hypothetical protein
MRIEKTQSDVCVNIRKSNFPSHTMRHVSRLKQELEPYRGMPSQWHIGSGFPASRSTAVLLQRDVMIIIEIHFVDHYL